MTAAAFLKLQRSGSTEPQVEALAEYLDSQAATRADLLELRGDLRGEMAELRAEVRREFAAMRAGLGALEQGMTIRLGFVLAAAVAIVAGLVRLL